MATATMVDRTEQAMRQAFWNLEMAERREQPDHVLDQMERRYFEALAAYERAHVTDTLH